MTTTAPSAAGRERPLLDAFVRLADTLTADYDVIELLHGLCDDCVALLGSDAAGLLLTDQRGNLQVVSASTEAAQMVELFQLQSEQGPCLDCFRYSAQVHVADLAAEATVAAVRRAGPRARASAPCTPCRCGCASTRSVR